MSVSQGDIVFYKDSMNGGSYRVALVVDVYGKEEQPACGLCVFVTGFHMPSYSVPRVEHGDKVNQYLTKSEFEGLAAPAASSAEEIADAAIAAAIDALEPIGDGVAQPTPKSKK